MLRCRVAVPSVARVSGLPVPAEPTALLGLESLHRARRARRGFAAPPEFLLLGVMTAEAFVRAARATSRRAKLGAPTRFRTAAKDVAKRHGA